jgi:septal ring factor EnvC (AmiA/AmiB activator)
MSAVGDILKSVREVLLLQSQVERLEQQIDNQNDELRNVARDLIALDKRVVRIETMIELSAGRGSPPPRIEG